MAENMIEVPLGMPGRFNIIKGENSDVVSAILCNPDSQGIQKHTARHYQVLDCLPNWSGERYYLKKVEVPESGKVHFFVPKPMKLRDDILSDFQRYGLCMGPAGNDRAGYIFLVWEEDKIREKTLGLGRKIIGYSPKHIYEKYSDWYLVNKVRKDSRLP
ncbi:MAG: hypothetical protein WCK90_00165 [archaeon]